MGKQTSATKGGDAGHERPRRLTLLTGALLLVGLGLAVHDLVHEQRAVRTSGDASLQSVARVAEALFGAEEARIQALLARLRIELRSNGGFAALGSGGADDLDPGIVRRIDNLLRRALEGSEEIVSFDLAVAGQVGISGLHLDPAAPPLREQDASDEAESRAKELWYADEVVEAVESKGRKVTRSPVTVETFGAGERALIRAVIALHDDEDVVQGALVATLDLVPLGTRLASLSTEAVRFSLVTAEGVRIGGRATAAAERIAAEIAALADATGGETSIVEAGGLRSLVRRASAWDESGGSVYLWAESDGPASLAMAGLLGPWPPALGGLVLLLVLGAWRDRSGAASDAVRGHPARAGERPRHGAGVSRKRGSESESGSPFDDEPSSAESDASDPAIRRERFVLREWLADVRGCLEREAASRGLTLVLRCERTLPREIEQDPHWLGGLLVSLGRDALDATSATRVALEVSGGPGTDLRFDLDAGEADLEPVGGMGEIAGRLGGSLEKTGRGRLALVLPGALA